MKREEFIAKVRFIGWIGYQSALRQPYNEQINDDQLISLLDGVRFLDDHPDSTPVQNHENWMRMKFEQGWIYGEVKDFDKKTHPDLVPFNELPEIEQQKNILNEVMQRLASQLWDNAALSNEKVKIS